MTTISAIYTRNVSFMLGKKKLSMEYSTKENPRAIRYSRTNSKKAKRYNQIQENNERESPGTWRAR